jgi:hypothetical protein
MISFPTVERAFHFRITSSQTSLSSLKLSLSQGIGMIGRDQGLNILPHYSTFFFTSRTAASQWLFADQLPFGKSHFRAVNHQELPRAFAQALRSIYFNKAALKASRSSSIS